ncbi:MAG: DUF1501 domain-containing protein [Planctomycetota bacterium]
MKLPLITSRRDLLARVGAGFGAVAWQAMSWQAMSGQAMSGPAMSGQARAASVGRSLIDPLQPMAARRPHFKPRAKSVIFLFMFGGPSQIDTYDYKPELQKLHGKPLPASFRDSLKGTKFSNVTHGCKDELLASPYKWKQYGHSGMWVSELFPHTAQHIDDLCFIHSLQADSNNHAPASYQLHTGDVRVGKASLGSWATYGLGSENQDLPGYVVLFDSGPLGGAGNYSNGFLPAAFQPTRLRDTGTPVLDLLPPTDFADGQRATLDLVRQLNLRHRETRAGLTDLDARIASYELAYRMQSSALEVGQLEDEAKHVQESYGLEHQDVRTRSFARKCLMARRLVERGVRFVQLYDMPDKDGWDAHGKLTDNHTPRARWTDQPVAALLADMKQRGLLDETLVIWASEFGRTPLMQGDNGRNHNAAGFTIWLAGGGVQPGQRIGATDDLGYLAIDRPTQFRDLHATILAALGLNNEELFFETSGRQERLTGVAGGAKVIPGVLS